MKSGYKEVHIDQKFMPFAVKKKRNKILRPSTDDNNRKSDHREIKKYRMVIDYEPTFPDIRVAFRKFKSRLEEDEELKEIFPKGIKHLQVSERRGAKNMKEILAPSVSAVNSADTAEGEHIEPSITRNATSMVENDNGYYPCGKNCAYCTLVGKSKGNTFKSVSNGKRFKIRQLIVRQRI